MGFGIKRALIRALDRPGLRGVLASGVNAAARAQGRSDFSVFHDNGFWFHTAAGVTFPGGPRFDQDPARIDELLRQEAKFVSDATDYWLHYLTLQERAVVVDVGAGQGEDVLALARPIGRSGRLLAIEAFPATYRALEEFCRRNDLPQVTPINVAIAAEEGLISFQESANWVENAMVAATPGTGSVRSASLSTICRERGVESIDYLKMNIEGAEVQALQGMEDMLPRIHAICVSCHDFRAVRGDGEQFRTKAFVTRFLSDRGFDLHFRQDPRPYVADQVFGVNRAVTGRPARLTLR